MNMAKWTYFGCLKQFQNIAKYSEEDIASGREIYFDDWLYAGLPPYPSTITIRPLLKMLRQHYPNRLFKSRWGYEPDSPGNWLATRQLCIYYREK